jgi:hypothetical protein
MLATGSERTIYGSEAFAVTSLVNPGECAEGFSTNIYTPSEQDPIYTDTSVATPPGYIDDKSGLELL